MSSITAAGLHPDPLADTETQLKTSQALEPEVGSGRVD